MSRTLSLETLQKKVRRALALQERGKVCFAKSEAILKQLGARGLKEEEMIDIGTDALYQLVDQFKNIIWTHAAARRWQLRKVSKRTTRAMSSRGTVGATGPT